MEKSFTQKTVQGDATKMIATSGRHPTQCIYNPNSIYAVTQQNELYTTCAFTRDSFKFFITHERNMTRRPKLHQSISLAEARKALEAHGCKFSVNNLSTVPHTLGILIANVTCCINCFELLQMLLAVLIFFELLIYLKQTHK